MTFFTQQKQAWEQMVTYLFFFFPPKCHYGQSAYYSNILLCSFCILNANPDVISWSQLLCTEEELAPACVVKIAVQAHKMVHPQPVLVIPSIFSSLTPNNCIEKRRVINWVLPVALRLASSFPCLHSGWWARGVLRCSRRLQKQQLVSLLLPLFYSKQGLGVLCIAIPLHLLLV